MGNIEDMEVKISINKINHEKYIKIIEYISGKEQKIKGKVGGSIEIYKNFHTKGRGIPLKYDLTLDITKVLDECPKDTKKIAESLKGLYDIIYKTEK